MNKIEKLKKELESLKVMIKDILKIESETLDAIIKASKGNKNEQ